MNGNLANAYRNFNHRCRGYRRQLEETMGDYEQLQAEINALKAENQRLARILRKVRFFCTYQQYRAGLHGRIWPLVSDFDDPGEPPEEAPR